MSAHAATYESGLLMVVHGATALSLRMSSLAAANPTLLDPIPLIQSSFDAPETPSMLPKNCAEAMN